jgi:hypothetical protein
VDLPGSSAAESVRLPDGLVLAGRKPGVAAGSGVSKHVDTPGSGTPLESEELPGSSAAESVRLPDGLVLAGRKPGASSGTGV